MESIVSIEKAFNSLAGSLSKYQMKKEKMTEILKGRIEFRFYIEALSGDGLCLGNEDTANICRLSLVIYYLQDNDKLSETEHLKLCI